MREINKVDPLLDSFALTKCGDYYLGNALDDFTSSPLYEDFRGIDNLVVFTGTRDVLYPMSRMLKSRCKETCIPIQYFEYKDSIHVFPIFRTKDGLDARDKMVEVLHYIL